MGLSPDSRGRQSPGWTDFLTGCLINQCVNWQVAVYCRYRAAGKPTYLQKVIYSRLGPGPTPTSPIFPGKWFAGAGPAQPRQRISLENVQNAPACTLMNLDNEVTNLTSWRYVSMQGDQ